MRMARMNGIKAKFAGFHVKTVACVFFGLLIAGCARHREFSGTEQRALATPPAFLIGPMALLLTNATSYNAQVLFQTQTAWGSTQAIRGDLTSAGSKLAFQPELANASRHDTE